MDHLREGISLVGYAQKKLWMNTPALTCSQDLDPRSRQLFYKIQVGPSPVRPIQETMPEQKMTMVHGESPETKPEELKQSPIQKVHIGRNDPCPCGSGKKYKQCHGKTQAAEAAEEEDNN